MQHSVIALAFVLTGALPDLVHAQVPEYDKTIFDDYTHLHPLADSLGGTDLRYVTAGTLAKLAKSDAVMVDESEVLTRAQSDYKGAKPADLQVIAAAKRTGAIARRQIGGYNLMDAPDHYVLHIRAALTDVKLTRKKRNILAYAPAGAVLKFGTDMLKDVMQSYDTMNMVFQARLGGHQTKEELANM